MPPIRHQSTRNERQEVEPGLLSQSRAARVYQNLPRSILRSRDSAKGSKKVHFNEGEMILQIRDIWALRHKEGSVEKLRLPSGKSHTRRLRIRRGVKPREERRLCVMRKLAQLGDSEVKSEMEVWEETFACICDASRFTGEEQEFYKRWRELEEGGSRIGVRECGMGTCGLELAGGELHIKLERKTWQAKRMDEIDAAQEKKSDEKDNVQVLDATSEVDLPSLGHETTNDTPDSIKTEAKEHVLFEKVDIVRFEGPMLGMTVENKEEEGKE